MQDYSSAMNCSFMNLMVCLSLFSAVRIIFILLLVLYWCRGGWCWTGVHNTEWCFLESALLMYVSGIASADQFTLLLEMHWLAFSLWPAVSDFADSKTFNRQHTETFACLYLCLKMADNGLWSVKQFISNYYIFKGKMYDRAVVSAGITFFRCSLISGQWV